MNVEFPPIRLSSIRLGQLQQLAEIYNLPSPAAVIARLINEKVSEGILPDVIPGLAVYREGENVVFAFAEEPPVSLPVIGAQALADALESVADGGSQIINLSKPFSFAVTRRGRSAVNVNIPMPSKAKTFTLDLAKDFARIVRKAAS